MGHRPPQDWAPAVVLELGFLERHGWAIKGRGIWDSQATADQKRVDYWAISQTYEFFQQLGGQMGGRGRQAPPVETSGAVSFESGEDVMPAGVSATH